MARPLSAFAARQSLGLESAEGRKAPYQIASESGDGARSYEEVHEHPRKKRRKQHQFKKFASVMQQPTVKPDEDGERLRTHATMSNTSEREVTINESTD